MKDILPESDWYDDKFLCSWYANQAPRAGTNLCFVPAIRYLRSGSDKKVLSR